MYNETILLDIFFMFYERKIYKELLSHLSSKQVTVITGMRRTGKTTLLKQLLRDTQSTNTLFFDLENREQRELFQIKNYDAIFQKFLERGLDKHKQITIAIDEIQLEPNIPSVIKYLYDHYDIKFIISGSSSYYLKNFFSESLAGRKYIFELFPLDFGEFLQFKNIIFTPQESFVDASFDINTYDRLQLWYEEYITFGGFPEVVLTDSIEEKKRILSDILTSYLHIDIRTLIEFEKEKELSLLIKVLASRVGSRLDIKKLAAVTGLNRMTVSSYLELFEKTYLISRIYVHTKNPDREIVKAQKLYFLDTGLLSALAEISSGAKFENAVFNQLRSKGEVRYFALKTGKEIDFVLDHNTGFETKERPTASDHSELHSMAKKAHLSAAKLIGRYDVPTFSEYIWGGRIV